MAGLKQRLLQCFAVAVVSCGASAQTYPSKPIRVIFPAVPGSAFDALGRLMATKIGESLGQPLVPDNRGGAGGAIGVEAAVRSAPDGYTLLWANPGAVVLTRFTIKNLPFDPLKDLLPISIVSQPVTVLVVNPKVSVSSVKELVELAKASPGKLSFGSAGIGSEFHLFGELFNQASGVRIVHVPYQGPAQAINDLMAGRIEMGFITLGTAMPQHKAGKLKILGILDPKRFAATPELPAVNESVPSYEPPRTWFGMMGPIGLPRPVVARIRNEIVNALNSGEVRAWLAANFHESVGNTPEEFAAALKKYFDLSAMAAKAAGLKPE